MTVLDLLTSGTKYLSQHGVEHSQLNAEYLLAHTLGKKRMSLRLELRQSIGMLEHKFFWELVRHRAKHYPLQYILGTVEFYGRQFFCDQRALIPRQETELLVELAMPFLLRLDVPITLLDVGTGSGVIAATLAIEVPGAFIDATDISQDALKLAAENLEKHRLTEHVQLQVADLLPAYEACYEGIFANLPYIPTGEVITLPPEVQHEPVEALDGGPGGIFTIKRLINSAGPYLRPGGKIWLEIGHQQGRATISSLRQNGFREIKAHRDYNNSLRFISGKR